MPLELQAFAQSFGRIYGSNAEAVARQTARYEALIDRFGSCFSPKDDLHLFSTPGRIEIGGNHTDHNHGRVLAAGIDLDAIAVAAANGTDEVVLYSEGYQDAFRVCLHQLGILEEEKGTTSSLIRGIAFCLKDRGHFIGGFDACVQSNVLPGSGLSSSASIEVLVATIFNALFNRDGVTAEDMAQFCQVSENTYFGKPSGLMDQMTCALGGIVNIDFGDPGSPLVRKVDFDFQGENHRILIVDTGGSHADLTDDYASIPKEMKDVANALGTGVCRGITIDDVMAEINMLRKGVGDRAVLRSLHFLRENARVGQQVHALEKGDFSRFLKLVRESGNSSFKWLQNIYSAKSVREQGVALALALTEQHISDIAAGACRVHGGGFAGTILAFLPENRVDSYRRSMESVFGPGCVLDLSIRRYGTLHLNSYMNG